MDDNDELVISVKNSPSGVLDVLVSVNGVALGVIQRVQFEANAENLNTKMIFTTISTSIEEISDSKLIDGIKNTIESLSKFLPWITILEKDFNGNVINAIGREWR